jgi:hypothetical protein
MPLGLSTTPETQDPGAAGRLAPGLLFDHLPVAGSRPGVGYPPRAGGFYPIPAGPAAGSGRGSPRLDKDLAVIQLIDRSSPVIHKANISKKIGKIAPNLQKVLIDRNLTGAADRVGVCGKYLALEGGCCGDRERVRVSCGHKLCPRCAGVRRWRTVQKYLPLVLTYKRPRFLTLTFINTPTLEFKRLNECWKRFLNEWYIKPVKVGRRKVGGRRFKDALGGGLRAVEVTHGKDGSWHPHFHVIYDGDYIPKRAIIKAWSDVTRKVFGRFTYRLHTGSAEKIRRAKAGAVVHEVRSDDRWTYIDMEKGAFIVDVQDVDSHPKYKHLGRDARREKGLRELVKYITKVCDFMEDDGLMGEFIDAAHGVRQIMPFGHSFGYKAPERPKEDRRFWSVDPFNYRGISRVPCRCGMLNWRVVGLMDRREVNEFIKNKVDPPPGAVDWFSKIRAELEAQGPAPF